VRGAYAERSKGRRAKGNENENGDAVASVQRAGGGTSGSASGDVCEEGEGI
jgi:hypothetical protein